MLNNTLRLHMNELPYLPPQRVTEAAKKGLEKINRYADTGDLETFRSILADYADVDRERIFFGPGSDMLLKEITYLFSRGRKIVMVHPTFLPTVKSARQSATKLVRIRLSAPNFKLDTGILLEELTRQNEPSLVIIDNPNNPTGKILLDEKAVKDILNLQNVLLVIDEAYYEFSGKTFASLVKNYPNLCISRSLDKAFSLAGLRIGYIIAGDSFIRGLADFYVYLPQPSLCAAMEALKNTGYAVENVAKITGERKRIFKSLRKLNIDVYDTETNFLVVKSALPDIEERLQGNGILVSDLRNALGYGFIRVSIGLPEENNTFLDTFSKSEGIIK